MQAPTRPLRQRHPEWLLLGALCCLALAVAVRWGWDRLAPSAAPPTPPAPLTLSSEQSLLKYQAALRANPDNSNAYAQLGLAYLQRLRETADPAYYGLAEQSFEAALQRTPDQGDALLGMGMLALGRHDFAGALRWGEQARAATPYRAEPLGVLVDGYVELGRYEEAVATLQRMVDLRPDQSSFSRVSYLRELHGDMPGAIAAMARAVEAGTPTDEGTLWSQVQLGHLHFNGGDLAQAEAAYQAALRVRPDYGYAQAGLARVQAARDDSAGAIATYTALVARLPLPEFVIALGELHEANGQPAEAEAQYALVRAMQQLNQSAGMDVDLELALFEAEHGQDRSAAVAQARAAYQRRPSLHAADALAWALYHNGQPDEALPYSIEALRLGTQDARLFYHAGMIALAVGDSEQGRSYLAQALALNPHFSPLHAPDARARLAALSGE